jgi:hypothetical protein
MRRRIAFDPTSIAANRAIDLGRYSIYTPRVRTTVLASLFLMLVGVGLCATIGPRLGGMMLLAGWLGAIGGLHTLARSPR